MGRTVSATVYTGAELRRRPICRTVEGMVAVADDEHIGIGLETIAVVDLADLVVID